MAKQRHNDWQDYIKAENLLTEPLQEEEPETVKIMLMHDVILNYTGIVTGKLYIFNRGGSTNDVDKRDAEIMLKRIEQQSCCGSISTPYFEIVR